MPCVIAARTPMWSVREASRFAAVQPRVARGLWQYLSLPASDGQCQQGLWFNASLDNGPDQQNSCNMLAPVRDNETTVYGFIRDAVTVAPDADTHERLTVNRKALLSLPSYNACALLYREMFSVPSSSVNAGGFYSTMMHFGAPYDRVEYEWEYWLEAFENMLKKMFWVSACVHLETPLAGTHTHIWESTSAFHTPQSSAFEMRCEWTKDKGFYRQLDYS